MVDVLLAKLTPLYEVLSVIRQTKNVTYREQKMVNNVVIVPLSRPSTPCYISTPLKKTWPALEGVAERPKKKVTKAVVVLRVNASTYTGKVSGRLSATWNSPQLRLATKITPIGLFLHTIRFILEKGRRDVRYEVRQQATLTAPPWKHAYLVTPQLLYMPVFSPPRPTLERTEAQ